jgi:hypothetical protein
VRGKPRSSTNPGAAIVALGAKAFQGADDFLGESIGLRGTTIDWCMAFGAPRMGGRCHVPSQALCAGCVPTVRPNWNLKKAAADWTEKRRVRLMQQLRLLRSAAAHEDLRHGIDHFLPATRARFRAQPKVFLGTFLGRILRGQPSAHISQIDKILSYLSHRILSYDRAALALSAVSRGEPPASCSIAREVQVEIGFGLQRPE